jgi:hypothetical protein
MNLLQAHDAVASYLGSTMSETPIDKMDDVQFTTHRALELVKRERSGSPFVITPTLWLALAADVDALQLDADALRTRLLDAERLVDEYRDAKGNWQRLYEETLVNLRETEAQRNLFETANALAERAIHELNDKVATLEARVAHLQRLGLDKEPSPG